MGSERRPSRLTKGDRIPAAWLNQVVEAIAQRITLVGGRVRRHGTSVILQPGSAGAAAAAPRPVRMFRLTSVSPDYIEALEWDGETLAGTAVTIAKPWLLRKTPFDGESIGGFSFGSFSADGTERTVTKISDSSTEDQIVVPAYTVAGGGYDGDVIFAMRPVGGTGAVDGDDEPIVWQDLNADARAWAQEAA